MKRHTNRSGFSILEVAIIVVVIAIIGLLAYTFYNRRASDAALNGNNRTNSQSAVATDVETAPAINDTASLDAAETVLDQTNPGGSNNADASQLDAELSTF